MTLLKAAKAKRVRSRIQKPFVRFIQAQLDVWNGPLSVQVLYFLFLLPHRRITLIHFYVAAATFMKNIRLLALARNVGIKHATLDTYIRKKEAKRDFYLRRAQVLFIDTHNFRCLLKCVPATSSKARKQSKMCEFALMLLRERKKRMWVFGRPKITKS